MGEIPADIAALWDIVRPGGVYPKYPGHAPVQQATMFHRYPWHFGWIADELLRWPTGRTPRVVCIGGSVGAEAYSLACRFSRAGVMKRFPGLTVETIDIDPVATAIARAARYPMAGPRGTFMRIRDDIRRHVTVHDAGDQQALPKSGPVDVLLCNNVLGHLSRRDGLALAEWLYAQKPRVLMTGGRLTRGASVHTPFNLHAAMDVNDGSHENADLYRIHDWAAQAPFDANTFRYSRDMNLMF